MRMVLKTFSFVGDEKRLLGYDFHGWKLTVHYRHNRHMEWIPLHPLWPTLHPFLPPESLILPGSLVLPGGKEVRDGGVRV